jgi:hypothetical protein
MVEKVADVEARKRSLEELEVELSQISSVVNLFNQDGWALLMADFAASKERVYGELVEDKPIDDMTLKGLRSELVTVERILQIDQAWRNKQADLVDQIRRLQDGTTEG